MPKRKRDDCEGGESSDEGAGGCETSSEDSNSSIKTDSSTDVPSQDTGTFTQMRKKQKKSVTFDGVTVFYFPRKQGFTCVPSQGGSSLGMGEKHELMEQFSISEYTNVQRQMHRQILLEQHSQGKINVPIAKLLPEKTPTVESTVDNDSEESDEDFTMDDYYFLQPVPTRQRRTLLRQSGVKKIDTTEKEDCKTIRTSREVCGCDCRVYCDPETCICSKAGIKCQVDRLSFPCGCSKDGCGNKFGRVEFNPIRVRTHFLHTVMRLEMEKKYGPENERRRSVACSEPDNSLVENGPRIEEDFSEVKNVPLNGNTEEEAFDEEEEEEIEEEEEDEDVEEGAGFNSNERGSCCDCQKSELSDILMQETQYSSSSSVDSGMSPHTNFTPLREEVHMNLVNSAATQQSDGMQQVMIFNGEDEDYNAENTTSMYQFPKEESSYSESSDCSSETSASPEPNFQTFQTLSSFKNEANGHSNGLSQQSAGSGSNYVIPPNHASSSYQQAAPQAEQKYVELGSSTSSSYKLEPISEILNPIRFSGGGGYGGSSSASSWNGDYTSQYVRPSDPNQNGVVDNGMCHASYTDNLNSNIPPLTTANGDFYVPPSVSTPSAQFMESYHGNSSCSSSLGWNSMGMVPACSGRVVAQQTSSTTTTQTNCGNKKQQFSNQLEPVNHSESPDLLSMDSCDHNTECDISLEPTLSEQSPAQNFGEIIKESIVETVSA